MVNCPLPEERNKPGYEFAKQSCGKGKEYLAKMISEEKRRRR